MPVKSHLIAIPTELNDDLCRFFNIKLKRRPSSAPLLSGDTYRAISDCLFDETHLCSAEEINGFEKSLKDKDRKNPLVFVSSWKLEKFVKEVLPAVKKPFVLLTHQGDVNIGTAEHKKILENKMLLHWFAQNNVIRHKKITSLPIGLEDAWRHRAGAVKDFHNKALIECNKEPVILYGFSINTNPESRAPCYISLCRNKYSEEIYGSLPPHLYRKRLSRKMFVASPAGNGLDCHRTWEAIYLGVVPVVEDNAMNRSFKKLGLPIVLVDPAKWDTLKKWTPESMKKLYEKIIAEGNTEAAFLPFWQNEFNKYLK